MREHLFEKVLEMLLSLYHQHILPLELHHILSVYFDGIIHIVNHVFFGMFLSHLDDFLGNYVTQTSVVCVEKLFIR